jgi:hypothetical protein
MSIPNSGLFIGCFGFLPISFLQQQNRSDQKCRDFVLVGDVTNRMPYTTTNNESVAALNYKNCMLPDVGLIICRLSMLCFVISSRERRLLVLSCSYCLFTSVFNRTWYKHHRIGSRSISFVSNFLLSVMPTWLSYDRE